MKKSQFSNSAFSLIEMSIVLLIIGILISGVTQGLKLLNKFKLQTAQSLTQSSPVASISGLSYWFESTSEKSFSASEAVDEEKISNWYDISPRNTVLVAK
ncbi:MAG: prepilin-type N-terminal cleavage/methylation domain-containing protein [Pelagibacterales bacterium]|nr:prepilin-type N-terminal cleavage/methylation domain-containing protein [Pelagibacterales bacterium]